MKKKKMEGITVRSESLKMKKMEPKYVGGKKRGQRRKIKGER